jgi:integrase
MGIDPAAERNSTQAQAVESFKVIADRFLVAHRKAAKPSTYDETKRYLLVRAKVLHGMPIATVTRRDVAGVLSATAANAAKGKGGNSAANRCRAALSSLFAWAMTEGVVEENPTIGTTTRAGLKRDRTLVDPETGDMSELVRVWRALDDSAFSDVVRLLILTAQRRDEIGGLRWSELDEHLTRIRLPAERVKNKREHLVLLSDAARAIIARQPRVVGQDCIFAVRSKHGLTGWDEHKKALDAELPGMNHWVLHDLRRSAATGMARIGVQPHVVEAVTNHQSGSKAGVAGVYNLNTYLPEKTAALTMWGEHVMAAISAKSAKVVPLRSAG